MSGRYTYVRIVLVLSLIALGSSPIAFQQPRATSPGAGQGQGSPSFNLSGLPAPVKGQAYRFSLCLGRLLAANEVSRPCNPADAASTVSGAAQNLPIVFRLGTTSFLPPGFTLDGNGVINGAANADLSKLRNVGICAGQVGGIGTNLGNNCQQVDFNGLKKVQTPQTAPVNAPPPAKAQSSGPGMGTALAVTGVVGAAAVGGAYYYQQNKAASCTQPDFHSSAYYNCGLTGLDLSTAACKTFLADENAYCKCAGFTGFSLNSATGCY